MKKHLASTAESITIPTTLAVPAFQEAWALWLQDRRDRRKPVTRIAATLQLRKLDRYGVVGAIASIQQSIENGWTGLFEPRLQDGSKVQPKLNRSAPKLATAEENPAWAKYYAGDGGWMAPE